MLLSEQMIFLKCLFQVQINVFTPHFHLTVVIFSSFSILMKVADGLRACFTLLLQQK